MSDKRLRSLTPPNLEYACIDDWRALHSDNTWGWSQFATMGRSWRVNSVWPLEWDGSGRTVDSVVADCARWAARHNVRLAFKLADGAVHPPDLPEHLTRLGFAPQMETLVMTRALEHIAASEREIPWLGAKTDDFVSVLRAASPNDDDFAERLNIITRMSNNTLFPIAHINRAPAAIGLGRHSGWVVGIYLMRTAPEMRRQGLARDIVRTICAWGRYHGAAAAFLQVEADNTAAIALYHNEGFEERYRYRYWLHPDV